MDPDRQKRREEIQNAMSFIQSSLPFPEPESCEVEGFLTQLVCDLLDEGNACFRDGDWPQATRYYGEGESVLRYAQTKALVLPHELLESFYVSRAVACYLMREYEQGVQNCDRALSVAEGSCRALYQKALCLHKLGQLREAYECGTKCLRTAPHDSQFLRELAQELANKLGLNGRKACVNPTASDRESHVETSQPTGEMSSNGWGSLEDIGPGTEHICFQCLFLSSTQCIPAPLATPVPVSDDPASPVVTPCTDLSESPSSQGLAPMQSLLPVSEHTGDCNSSVHEKLDSLLHCMPKNVCENPVQGAVPTNLPNTAVGTPYSPGPSTPSQQSSQQCRPASFSYSISEMPPLEPLGQRDQGSTQAQDALGAFCTGATAGEGKTGLDSLSEYTLPGGRVCPSFIPGMSNHSSAHANGPDGTNLALLSRSPLAATHEFRQACHACCSHIGPRVMDCKYQPEAAHHCKRDVLLCRLQNSGDPTWKRIRRWPANSNFLGAFVLCEEGQECWHGDSCTFAHCQEEIDVWTQERKSSRRARSVTRLLKPHMALFMFLCEECFDSKPRIISKRSKENMAVCSNLTARHPFDDNKCLVHVMRSTSVLYSKVRPLHPLCQFDLCRHEVQYGCQREDSCLFAHSVIELNCWVLQQGTGITQAEMVWESTQHSQRLEQKPVHIPHLNSSLLSAGAGGTMGSGAGGGVEDGIDGGSVSPISGAGGLGAVAGRRWPLNLKMKFVCSRCWREGQVNEPDKNLNYCTAKARHSWPEVHKILLVKSFEKKNWVVVRPLPFSGTYYDDMCVHVMKHKKCHIGNCSFAHSIEERDFWTYMKDNSLRDMRQVYELWLQHTNQSGRT